MELSSTESQAKANRGEKCGARARLGRARTVASQTHEINERRNVTRIGSAARDAERQEASAQTLVDSVSSRRQSTSGVSMDEEMTNMIRFQRAFQASSRAMNTMDELLDTLINHTGRVGI